MPEHGATYALARLLSDADLRGVFAADPERALAALSLDAAAAAALRTLDPSELEAQARTLLHKRLLAARMLLPRTFDALGPDADAMFLVWAQTTWPTGHRRHEQDADGFCRHLAGPGSRAADARECRRLAFLRSNRRLVVHLLRRGVVRGRAGPALQVLYRGSGSPRELLLYAIPLMRPTA